MDPATYLITAWGIPGALLVVVALWAVRNQRTLEAGTSEHAKQTLELQATHATKTEALQTAHASKLEALQVAHLAERERVLAKLEAEHAARLTDAQTNTRAMLDLSEQVHATVEQLSELAERLSARPRS